MPHTAIHPTVLAVYKDNLNALTLSEVEDATQLLEDVAGFFEEAAPIRMASLPAPVPEVVRRELVALSKEYAALAKQIHGKLDELYSLAEDVYDAKEEEEQAAKPKCDKCGQVIKKVASTEYVPVPKKKAVKMKKPWIEKQ